MATPSKQPRTDVGRELREAVNNSQWTEVVRLIHRADSSEQQQHPWAITYTVRHAPEWFVEDNLDGILACAGDQLDIVLSPLLARLVSFVAVSFPSILSTRRVCSCISRVLQRDMSSELHRHAVVECAKYADDVSFQENILPHCMEEELDDVLSHLVSQGLWRSVGTALGRGVSDDRHRWAVVEASRHADDHDFTAFILPFCIGKEREQVLTHLVTRHQWWSVGEVLPRGVSDDRHRWAVAEASKHADDYVFFLHILPCCTGEELEQVLTHLVSRGLWRSVGNALGMGVIDDRHKWAVVEASRQADDLQFTTHILHHCTEDELDQVLTHLVLRGMWMSVGNAPRRGVSDDRHRWAVAEASRHADDDDFTEHILPHCTEEVLEQVLTHLVSRGLWELVGRVLARGVSDELHRWTLVQAAEHAVDKDFVQYILPHCHDDDMDTVITTLVSRCLWVEVEVVLRRGVSDDRHRWTVVEASKHSDDHDFTEFIFPHCTGEEMELVFTHLVSRGLWRSVGKVLQRGVSDNRHRWSVEQAAEHADDDSFDCHILPHCSTDDVVAAFPFLVASRKWNCVQHVMYDVVRDTLHTWVTSGHDSTAHDTLFWKLLRHCRVDVSLALGLTKAVTGNIVYRRYIRGRNKWVREYNYNFKTRLDDLARRISWQRDLCEALMTSLLHTLCCLMCGDDTQYTDSTEHTKQCVSDIYTHITACIKDNDASSQHSRLKSMQTRQKLTAVFSEIADTHQNDSLFLIHFLQGLNLYHVSKQRENDDSLLLGIFAVFPLFPQLQSVVLSMMLRKKKWDVLSQACLSHVWEHDRRRLLEAAVLQRQWSVIKQWSDHTVHDDEREWAMAEILKEALKHRAVKEIFKNNFKKKITENIQREAFKSAFKAAFNDNTFLQTYKRALERKVPKLSIEPFNERVFVSSFKDDFTGAFQAAFNKETFKRVFKDNALNETIYKDIVTRDDFKEESLQEAFIEAFEQRKFELNFKRKIALKAFELDVLKGTFKDETYKDALKEEAFKAAFKEREFEWKTLQEVFPGTFPEWFFIKAFKEAFVSLKEELFVCYKDPFLDAYRENAIGSLLEAFRKPFTDEDFTDTYEDKWMSYLLLADHGLTSRQHMHAIYMLGKYSPWNIVIEMVERGGDLTEVHNLLGNWVTGNLRKKPQGDLTVFEQRYDELVRTRRSFATDSYLIPSDALMQGQWGTVMFNILHRPQKSYFSQVIHKVIEEEQWHILKHLVRLGMSSVNRNRLFPKMVRQQRWDVCRMLLEQVVDEQLCVKALTELMDRNQWILVARVMEYNLDDALRRQVMQCAFHRRAGMAFWHCLNVMEDKQPLTKEARVKLFHQAISRDIWQAVKPLVGEKDGPGIQRRDMAFLEAIEQHVWDAVGYFQFNNINADINMKDENGETPLHREARKGEWLAVKEIVFRDANPNLLDKDGVSVLNRLIHHRQWGIVKFVIMYGGDIHLQARYSEDENEDEIHSPLQALITARQADIIKMSFMWCGDQKKGVNHMGENCLHAICDSDYRWDAMEKMMLRKVNPLAVTRTGKSPLVYAVLNRKCPERMVAECSRMGFNSHQPSVTGPQRSMLEDITNAMLAMWGQWMNYLRYTPRYFDCQCMQQKSDITSPLVCAVLRDSAVLVHMLYESAACSRTEVVTLYTQLPRLTDITTAEGKRLQEDVQKMIPKRPNRADVLRQYYHRLIDAIERHTALLRELDSTPRTLRSSCRLRILQHFPFSNKKRLEFLTDPRMLESLPLPEPVKDYLQFSDLRDADYGKKMGLPSEDILEVASFDQSDDSSED